MCKFNVLHLSGQTLKNIPGFDNLKAWKHDYWYIVDKSPGTTGDPFKDTIGGYFETYGQACSFAQDNYIGHYQ